MALMREEIAIEKAAAGEVCIWNDAEIDSTLWFITQRARENDSIIRALNEIQRELWAATHVLAQERAHGLVDANPSSGRVASSLPA